MEMRIEPARHRTEGKEWRRRRDRSVSSRASSTRIKWDYGGLQAVLNGCSRVILDLDNAHHEIFVKIARTG
jgi:hypothetical protein